MPLSDSQNLLRLSGRKYPSAVDSKYAFKICKSSSVSAASCSLYFVSAARSSWLHGIFCHDVLILSIAPISKTASSSGIDVTVFAACIGVFSHCAFVIQMCAPSEKPSIHFADAFQAANDCCNVSIDGLILVFRHASANCFLLERSLLFGGNISQRVFNISLSSDVIGQDISFPCSFPFLVPFPSLPLVQVKVAWLSRASRVKHASISLQS